MNQYNLEYIERLRIHELRDYARKIGVHSPTTMKKNELLAKINEIISSKDSVCNDQCDGSHEHLDFFTLLTSPNSDILDNLLSGNSIIKDSNSSNTSNTLIMKKDDVLVNDSLYTYTNDNYTTLNLSVKQNEATYNVNEGILDIHKNGYGIIHQNGFLSSNDDIYITLALVKKYNLKKGDYVKGRVKLILENNPRIMYEIISIDGNNDPNYVPFDLIPYKSLGDCYKLDNSNMKIKRGERIYLKDMDLLSAYDLASNLIDKNNINIKFINVNAKPEDNFDFNQKINLINCPFNATAYDLVTAIELVIERIKREFENHKSNILFIYNFSEMIRYFNVEAEGCYVFDRFNLNGINRIKNILSTAKNFIDGTNVTIICLDQKSYSLDLKNIMETEILPIFNKVI